MIIKRIALQNFGLYKGEHVIDFNCESQDKVVTLIGGLNGRGKTTFLDAIILGLYGRRALKYLQDERIKYSNYVENHVTKGIPAGSQTRITITLLDSDAGNESITINRIWEKNLVGVSDEKVVAYRNGLEDNYLSTNWDYFVEEVLPLTISRFFFFDNEKIAQIADDETFESVKDSIRALLGFTTIDQLITDMGRLAKKTEDAEGQQRAGSAQLLEDVQKEIDDCEQEAKELYDDAGHYQAEITRLRNQLDEETERFWKNGGNLGLEKERLEKDKKSHSDNIAKYTLVIREYVDDPTTPLLLCKNHLERVEKRQSSYEQIRTTQYYRKFINHLLEKLTKSDEYPERFVNEALSFLHAVSSEYAESTDAKATDIIQPETLEIIHDLLAGLEDRRTEIDMLVKSLKETSEKLLQVEAHLSREINETETQEARTAMTEIRDKIVSLEVDKRLADEKRAQCEKEKERLLQKRSRILSDMIEAKKDNSEKERVVRYTNIVIQAMEAFKENLLEEKLDELSQKILTCFRTMVKKDSMIQNITIDPATLDIKLVDYTGGELLKTQLSAGEKQLFAVSIIWGLAQCSGYDMPVVIDTPLGRLDSQHRSSFVEGYLPNAGKQVIILSTDEEIYGRYYQQIQPYISKEYTLVYNDETKSTSIKTGYQWGDKE